MKWATSTCLYCTEGKTFIFSPKLLPFFPQYPGEKKGVHPPGLWFTGDFHREVYTRGTSINQRTSPCKLQSEALKAARGTTSTDISASLLRTRGEIAWLGTAARSHARIVAKIQKFPTLRGEHRAHASTRGARAARSRHASPAFRSSRARGVLHVPFVHAALCDERRRRHIREGGVFVNWR